MTDIPLHSVPPPADYFSRYENGEMTEPEVIEFFQYLVDSGLAWILQGSYGRQAVRMINGGSIQPYPRPKGMERRRI